MENEHLAVTVNANGTLTVRDKKTGRLFEGLGYFRDSSEIGNPWEHYSAPKRIRIHYTERESPDCSGAGW